MRHNIITFWSPYTYRVSLQYLQPAPINFVIPQLIITPMIPDNTSAAFMPNLPKSDAKALSLFLSHSFTPFLSLEGAFDAPPPPGSNVSTKTLIAIPIDVSTEAIVMPCFLNNVLIFSVNEVSLSNTLTIVSLKLVIWFFSLPLRRLILSCLAFSLSFSLEIHFMMSSGMSSS